MKKHQHLFKQVGSGCMMIETKDLPCDADYSCECGVKFTLKTDRIGHMYLPEYFYQTERSEIKQAELDAINGLNLPDEISPR